MTETTSPAPAADAITPANILQPASVPVPTALNAPAETATAKPDAATAPAENKGPPEEGAKKDDENQEPKRNRASERISELYGRAKAAEREAATRAQEVYELRKQLEELNQPPADPLDLAGQQRNDVRSAVKEERMYEAARQAHKAANEAHELRRQSFMEKIDAAKDRLPDFNLADFASVPVSDVMAELIAESDKAAEITYHLTKNPDEARRIASLPPARQAYELAKLEHGKISKLEPRKTSNAPPPTPMIGASSAPASVSLQDAGVSDIARMLGYGR